jgi:hypothetical protein
MFEGVGALLATPVGLYYTIYVVENNGDVADAFLPGTLLRVPLAGGQPTAVAYGYLFAGPLLNGTSVIVAARGGMGMAGDSDVLFVVPIEGGTPSVLFTLPPEVSLGALPVTDGRFVYFTEDPNVCVSLACPSSVVAFPLDADAGTAPVRIATTPFTASVSAVGAIGSRLLMLFPQGAVESVPLPPQADSAVSNGESSNETGIVVVGPGVDGRARPLVR